MTVTIRKCPACKRPFSCHPDTLCADCSTNLIECVREVLGLSPLETSTRSEGGKKAHVRPMVQQ